MFPAVAQHNTVEAQSEVHFSTKPVTCPSLRSNRSATGVGVAHGLAGTGQIYYEQRKPKAMKIVSPGGRVPDTASDRRMLVYSQDGV